MNEVEIRHMQMVSGLVKPGEQILATLTPEKVHQWHMSTGIVGEAGELIDAFKKFIIYNKELDRKNVIEELGDLEFYMQGIREACGITRDETLVVNLDKLGKRYQGHRYTDGQAQARADKLEHKAID